MPALPADIAAALRAQINVSTSDATIKSRFPNARDGNLTPADGYFDDPAHAQLAVNQRAALIGAVRSRASVDIAEIVAVDGSLPTHRIVDAEQGIDLPMLLSRIEQDRETETTASEYFG